MRLNSAKQIPPNIQACARIHSLGSPRIVYEPKRSSSLHLVFGPLALILGGLIIGAYILFYDSIFSWWQSWQGWLVLGVGVAWLCVGMWIIFTPIIYPHLRVYLCPKGLIYERRGREVIRWDRIERLSREMALPGKKDILCSYQIWRDDGAIFELGPDLPYIDRLGRFMEREAARHLLPRVIAAYDENGTPQEFADIIVSHVGIGLKSTQRLLPWSEFEKLSFDETSLSLYRRGDTWAWTTLSIFGVPNTEVLRGLVRHIKSRLRERILREFTPVKSTQMQAYDAGFAIPFGTLSLSKHGVSISSSEDVLPWDEIASFGVGENEVIIKRSGLLEEWYTLPTWTIPDLPGLRQLVDYALWQQEQ